MQLRVARLCLDCEELHNADTCPRCASSAYAFLSSWLPVEERRKWRRPAPTAARRPWWTQGPAAMVRAFGRWLSGEPEAVIFSGPATRAADHAAQMNFDQPDQKAADGSGEVPLPKRNVPNASART